MVPVHSEIAASSPFGKVIKEVTVNYRLSSPSLMGF